MRWFLVLCFPVASDERPEQANLLAPAFAPAGPHFAAYPGE
jgi:hypothetical protein